jgi:branched-chain amino acid transport system substrate-binding protein
VIAQVMPQPFGGTNAAARELAILARSNGIEELTYNPMEGFLSAKVLIAGLRRAGKRPTPATLARALEGMHEVDLGG